MLMMMNRCDGCHVLRFVLHLDCSNSSDYLLLVVPNAISSHVH
jgi:hypothetical protein